jgi:predicted MFS family arabinose efflux permease
MLATLSISLAVMKMRVVPAQKRKLWDIAAFKDKPYLFFTIGVFFAFMGLYTPFFYVQSYVIEDGIMNVNTAFYMLSVLNAASIFGRIIPGLVADKVGPFNIVIPGTIAACVLAFGWIGIHSVAGIIVFCILYGFFSGCFVSIPPTVIVTLCPHPSVIGTRMGMCFALGGLGLLCGTPVAGQLINQYNFISGIAFSAVAIALGVVCMVAARISKTGLTFKVIA